MPTKQKTQVKFTIDSDIASSFKAQCAAEGISMASVICEFMKTSHPAKDAKLKNDTRRHRKKAVMAAIGLVEDVLRMEEQYRDAIPEQFEGRFETADQTCEQLEQAISCLEDAF